MFLARAFLNPLSRAVRADLADVASLHRTVMRAFPEGAGPSPRRAYGVLHRVDEDARRGRFVLLVQSASRPDFGHAPPGYFLDLRDDFELGPKGPSENPAVRDVDEERRALAAGERFAFRLCANTTRKVTKLSDGGSPTKNGTRIPVRGDEQRTAWLARHAARAGFKVDDARITEIAARFSRGRRATFAGARFDGTLTITDADAFREALAAGIGPAKAFGFGLLSIQRVRP